MSYYGGLFVVQLRVAVLDVEKDLPDSDDYFYLRWLRGRCLQLHEHLHSLFYRCTCHVVTHSFCALPFLARKFKVDKAEECIRNVSSD